MICKKKDEAPFSAHSVCLCNVEVTVIGLGECAGDWGSRSGSFLSKLPKNRPCLRILGYRLQRTEGGPWRGQCLAEGPWGAQADARGPAVRRGGPGVWETRGAAREPGEGEPGGDGSRRGAWKGSQRCGGRARAETQSRARRPPAASEWTPRRRSRDSGTQAEPAPGPFSGSDSGAGAGAERQPQPQRHRPGLATVQSPRRSNS